MNFGGEVCRITGIWRKNKTAMTTKKVMPLTIADAISFDCELETVRENEKKNGEMKVTAINRWTKGMDAKKANSRFPNRMLNSVSIVTDWFATGLDIVNGVAVVPTVEKLRSVAISIVCFSRLIVVWIFLLYSTDTKFTFCRFTSPLCAQQKRERERNTDNCSVTTLRLRHRLQQKS